MMAIYNDGIETIVCEKKNEKKMLKEYFIDGGRRLDDYDVEYSSDQYYAVKITSLAHVSVE